MPEDNETRTANEQRSNDPAVPEMIAATAKPLFLNSDGGRVTLQIHAPTGPARLRRPESQEFFVLIQNVTCDNTAPNFLAYLNLPAGEDPKKRMDLYAGGMGMFGLPDASMKSSKHSGSGLSFTLDITDLYHSMQERHLWNASQVTVSFVAGHWSAPVPQVKVGRVSLYVQ